MGIAQIAAGCVLVGVFVGCQVQGWRLNGQMMKMRADATEARIRVQESARAAERERFARAHAVAEAEALRNQKREVVTKVVTEEVIKYVQKPVAAECGLDPDGVRIHNLAARGVPRDTETTAQSDAPAKRATAASVVQTVANNYATCHETSDRLVSLQEWVKSID